MNWRKGAYALVGGALGFLIVLVAHFTAIGVAIQTMGFFGSSSFTTGQALIFYFVVPLMTIAGAALTAKSLGANWRRSLAAGTAAFAVILGILLAIPKYSNYSPFNQNETLTLVCPAVAAVLVAIARKADTKPTGLIVTIGLTALLVLCAIFTEGYGFIIALLSWLLIPAFAGLFRRIN